LRNAVTADALLVLAAGFAAITTMERIVLEVDASPAEVVLAAHEALRTEGNQVVGAGIAGP